MFAKLRKTRRDSGQGAKLVERHFALQEERPAYVREVEIEHLDPFLRNLLFTDGTVTRALGVQTLDSVSVEPIDQSPAAMSAEIATQLEIPVEEESIRRRVGIGVGSPVIPVLCAESFLIPDRLPPGFLGLLDGAPGGIGQSLQRVSLESTRELCWYGLEVTPEWAPPGSATAEGALRRTYRIVNDGRPAILISEYFAVERHLGVLHLAGLLAHRSQQRQAEGVG